MALAMAMAMAMVMAKDNHINSHAGSVYKPVIFGCAFLAVADTHDIAG